MWKMVTPGVPISFRMPLGVALSGPPRVLTATVNCWCRSCVQRSRPVWPLASLREDDPARKWLGLGRWYTLRSEARTTGLNVPWACSAEHAELMRCNIHPNKRDNTNCHRSTMCMRKVAKGTRMAGLGCALSMATLLSRNVLQCAVRSD
jgi:hypothetical protein